MTIIERKISGGYFTADHEYNGHVTERFLRGDTIREWTFEGYKRIGEGYDQFNVHPNFRTHAASLDEAISKLLDNLSAGEITKR